MGSSIHVVFLRNQLYLGRTDVTSFFMHFEKIGRVLLREGKRREGEWAVWAKREGMNRKYLSCKIKSSPLALPTQPTHPLSVYLPALTHVLFFQNACEMTSRPCVPGRVDSAKKHHVYYSDILN